MGLSQIRALVVDPMGMVTSSNSITFALYYENMEKNTSNSQKLFNLCFWTDILQPHRWERDFLRMEIYTFLLHSIHLFVLLTPFTPMFVKEYS